VLNAADPHVAAMALLCPGRIVFFAPDRHHPVMATHRAKGQRVVYLEGDAIVAAEGSAQQRLPLAGIPLTHDGAIGFQVENAMAAIGAAWAAGLGWDVIRDGLASFEARPDTAPGRFNLFGFRGATVIGDYGHNPDAMRALVAAIDRMPAKRRVLVISGAGDRRDEDLREQTRILGEAFDEVVLYEDACQRGRRDGEVVALLRQGLAKAKRAKTIKEVRGELVAIDTAFAHLAPGELCLVLVDQVETALGHIARRAAES
jgi:cyanophycin synthetase